MERLKGLFWLMVLVAVPITLLIAFYSAYMLVKSIPTEEKIVCREDVGTNSSSIYCERL